MSIIGLDSATPPTAAQADAAYAAGIRLWNGYLQTRPNVGLYHGWAQPDFENARRCGSTPIAFASGWDDPNSCRQLAAQWNVRLCLDVESGIRGDGPWVQPWLDASGAGLYGNLVVHTARRAAFHVLAWYLADPKATWPSWAVRPSSPTGWQFWNTHNEFGVGVDRAYYDDWFAGSTNATAGSEVIVPEEDYVTPRERFDIDMRFAFFHAQGGEPSDPQHAQYMSAYDKDPTQAMALIIQILDDPKSQAYEKQRSAVIAAGPAQAGSPGPPGPAGPAGPIGPAAPPHKHTVTGTAEINT